MSKTDTAVATRPADTKPQASVVVSEKAKYKGKTGALTRGTRGRQHFGI